MIAKIIEGTSFKGCVNYVLKDKSEIIDANGLCITSAQTIARDFNLQRQLNPDLNKAVGHIVLAWHEKDAKRIDSSIMATVARQYLDKMGIKATQYVAVRHYDRNHPHLHIIYNRVGFDGKSIANNNLRFKSVKLCKELNAKYRFHQSTGKDNVNVGRLKGAEKVKHQMFYAIKTGIETCKDWKHLEEFLKYKGISIQFKYKGDSDEVQGVSFQKNGYKFKGSEIDRLLSFKEIDQIFNPQVLISSESEQKNTGAPCVEPEQNQSKGIDFVLDISHDQDDEYSKKKKQKLKAK